MSERDLKLLLELVTKLRGRVGTLGKAVSRLERVERPIKPTPPVEPPHVLATGPDASVAVTGTTFTTVLSKSLVTTETYTIQVTGMLTVNLTTLGVSPRNTAWTWRVTLDGVPQTGLNAQRQGGFQPQNSHGAICHTFESIAAGTHTVALQIAAGNAGDTINLPVGFATFTAVATVS